MDHIPPKGQQEIAGAKSSFFLSLSSMRIIVPFRKDSQHSPTSLPILHNPPQMAPFLTSGQASRTLP
jgi:hypothetical protein